MATASMFRRRDLLAATSLLPLAGLLRAQTAAPSGVAPLTTPVSYTAEDLRHAEALRTAALADTEAWKLVSELVTTIGARPAGSAAEKRAAQWAMAQHRRLGLQNVRSEEIPLRVWQRGPASAALVAPVAEPLVMAALGNSVAAPPEGIEAEVAWYANFDALKADTSERAKGRIVFIDQKTERTRDGSGYGAAVGARAAGAVEAARRGALAVGIRSIGTDRERIAHTGAMRYEIGVPRIPAFAVSVPDADRIAALQAAGGTPLRMKFTLDAKSDVEATTQNVIAEVPGTDLASEIVLISGHLDSWDLGLGAIDDGAGVAIATAAAAVIQRAAEATKLRPRRTIRVVLWGNEENGFDGARAYAERYKDVPHQLVGESDFGAGKVWRLRSRVQPAALALVQEWARLLAPLGVAWPEEGRNAGTPGPDAGVLMRRHKWPAVDLSQDGSAYFDVHHTVHDTLDRIDPATLPQNVACWAVVAWLAAQAPVPLGPAPL